MSLLAVGIVASSPPATYPDSKTGLAQTLASLLGLAWDSDGGTTVGDTKLEVLDAASLASGR